MKTKIILFFLITIGAYAQRPKLHLIIAADVEDNAYTVRNFSKQEKIKNLFSLVSMHLNFNLEIKYLHTYDYGFSSKGVLDTLNKIKILTKDDIVVFYYLGRGYYPNSSSKVPFLEFQDSKKMLSFDQIRKKITPKKARLTLIVADCDESNSLLNPNVLPYSLIRTSQVKPIPDVLEKAMATMKSDFWFYNASEEEEDKLNLMQFKNSEDSIYAENCILELEYMLNSNKKHKKDLEELRHISLLSNIISDYSRFSYPSAINNKGKLESLLYLEEKPFRIKDISLDDYKFMVDTLFRERAILDFENPINVGIRNLFQYEKRILVHNSWLYEDLEKILYYSKVMDELKLKLSNIKYIKPLKSREKYVLAVYEKLDSYKYKGFPSESENDFRYRQEVIKNLPKVTKENFKIVYFESSGYQEVIDSVFLKRVVLSENDPLNLLLDSLIEFANRPLIYPIEFLSANEINKFYDDLNKLELLVFEPIKSLEDSIQKSKFKYFLNRLSDYPKIGFPDKNIDLIQIPSGLKDNDINNLTDYLFIKNQLFNLQFPLQLKLDSIIDNSLSIYTIKLKKNEWDYYLKTLNTLTSSNINFENEILKIALNRLKQYPISGFPDSTEQFKFQIDAIPNIVYSYQYDASKEEILLIRNKSYDRIIDSLYLEKKILDYSSPLYLKLKEFLLNDLPIGYPKGPILKSMEISTSIAGPVIRQLFLSECGIIEVANGHTRPLKKNQYIGNYTDSLTKKFNDLINTSLLSKIGKLSLSNLFVPLNNLFIHDYKRANSVKCPLISSSSELFLPDFKKIPTESQVNDLFDEYIKTKNVQRKKVLKSEITGHFERKAILKVKPLNLVGRTPPSLLNIPIDEYFTKLDKNTPKVDSVGVRQGSVRRNRNFSKITSMMLVEN